MLKPEDVVILTFGSYDDYKILGVFKKLKPFTEGDLKAIAEKLFREKPFGYGGVVFSEEEYLARLRRDGFIGDEPIPVEHMWVESYCYPHPDSDKHPPRPKRRGGRGSSHE